MFKVAVDPLKLDLFLEINNLINSSYFDLNGLFTQILESAMRLTDGEASSLLLLRSETQTLEFVVALGSKGEAVKSFTLKRGEGIAGWVAENNTSLVVHDVEKDNRFFAAISQNVGFSTKSILAVPLRVKGRCVGVVEMINKKNNAYFNEEDMTWLEVFSNQAGLALQNARSWKALQDELQSLRAELQNQISQPVIIGQSKKIIDLLQLCKKFSLTDSIVLINGESGTGKELIAEYIHYHSPRSNKVLVRVNCASLPESLLETELFGHVKGAFTDAVQDKIGRFELAQGGTIFLDEIAEIPMSLQAKLLRVIQSRKIEKVGSQESIDLDVRIIVATNKDLGKMIEDGTFRKDLYYRINVLPVVLPTLRERTEDIPLLVDYFIKEKSKLLNISTPRLTPEAMRLLQDKKWLGNVRELSNAVERLLVLNNDQIITAEKLCELERDFTHESLIVNNDLKMAINSFKAGFIKDTLVKTQGNQTKAAQLLGIQRTYLSKLLKELSIEE